MLNLSGCSLNDSDIKKILAAIPVKEKLKILKLDQIRELKIFPISQLKPFSNLEEISFADSGLQNFSGAQRLLPRLTKIDLSGCKISGDNIAKITYQASSLKRLVIDGSGEIEISEIIQNPEALEELGIRNYHGTDLNLKGFSNLKMLDLFDSKKLKNLGLGKFDLLRELTLSGSLQLTKSSINRIIESTLIHHEGEKVSTIEKIDLSEAILSDGELQQILKNRLVRLKNLDLSGLVIKPIGNNYTVTIPESLTSLSKINLSGANLTSLSLETLELKEIDCSDCKFLESLQSDPDPKHLEEINFEGCKKLSGNIIFDFIEQSLPTIKVLNVIENLFLAVKIYHLSILKIFLQKIR